MNKKVSKKSKFRIRGKYFFLTFPKTKKHDLESIIKVISEKETNLEFILVAEELYKFNFNNSEKENYHYCIIIIFNKNKDIQSSTYFNYIFSTQGHYEKIYRKDLSYMIRYCKGNKNRVSTFSYF